MSPNTSIIYMNLLLKMVEGLGIQLSGRVFARPGFGSSVFFFFWGGEVEHRVLRKGKIGAGGDGGGGDRGEYLMFVSVPKEQKFSQFQEEKKKDIRHITSFPFFIIYYGLLPAENLRGFIFFKGKDLLPSVTLVGLEFYIDQAALELSEIYLPLPPRLKACAVMPGYITILANKFYDMRCIDQWLTVQFNGKIPNLGKGSISKCVEGGDGPSH